MRSLLPHHQSTVDRLTDHFKADPNFTALIIGGSVAKGYARPDSDVDFYVVATDEEYAAANRQPVSVVFLGDGGLRGGYVDGKIVDLAFLRDVAEKGSDPARAAFVGAFSPYSELPELPGLLERILTYPEAQREERLISFYAQIEALKWYVGEAEKRADPYLMMQMASELALYGGRMILAYNRVLYPYHKWFTRVLEETENKRRSSWIVSATCWPGPAPRPPTPSSSAWWASPTGPNRRKAGRRAS
jgi:hypothetical protein